MGSIDAKRAKDAVLARRDRHFAKAKQGVECLYESLCELRDSRDNADWVILGVTQEDFYREYYDYSVDTVKKLLANLPKLKALMDAGIAVGSMRVLNAIGSIKDPVPVMREAIERHGPNPSGAQVKAVAAEFKPPKAQPKTQPEPEPDDDLDHDLEGDEYVAEVDDSGQVEVGPATATATAAAEGPAPTAGVVGGVDDDGGATDAHAQGRYDIEESECVTDDGGRAADEAAMNEVFSMLGEVPAPVPAVQTGPRTIEQELKDVRAYCEALEIWPMLGEKGQKSLIFDTFIWRRAEDARKAWSKAMHEASKAADQIKPKLKIREGRWSQLVKFELKRSGPQKWRICRSCGGAGQVTIPDGSMIECHACGGSGYDVY